MRETMIGSRLRWVAAGIVSLLALAGGGCGSDTGTTKLDTGTPSMVSDGSGGAGGSPEGGINPVPGIDAAASDGPVLSGDVRAPDAPSADVAIKLDASSDVPTLGPDAPPPMLCGNGVKDPSETCDPTSKDPAGRCPDICPPVMCSTRKMVNAGTCQAQCVNDQAITACTNGDGCCAPGCNANNDTDCQPMCGNGVQEAGETCDPLTNCPETCPQERCEIRKLFNAKTCQAECRTTSTITACINNDGCCPPGCLNRDDNDCDPSCDNGVKEMDETCDPRSTCPTAATCKNDGCKRYVVKNPDTCKAACVLSEIFAGCVNNDGCCSAGCNANNDSDCKPVCGNGVVEGDETCEPGTDKPCPETCPPFGCTVMQLEGTDVCHRRCAPSGGFITKCIAGVSDMCCPAGCNAMESNPNQDFDCHPTCGNGVLEGTENCDDAMCGKKFDDCVDSVEKVRVRTGLVGNCSFKCEESDRACSTTVSDTFCPSKCTPDTDIDCVIPDGNSCTALNAGQCAHKLCVDGHCCAQNCASCQNCTGPGGTCQDLDGVIDSTPSNADPQDSCDITVATTKLCSHGKCKLLNLQPCTNPDGSQCVNNVCQAGKCRPFACHVGDQDWTVDDQCRTLNGQTCVSDPPCFNLRCDAETNKCVASCGDHKTTAITGLPDPTGTGTCKLINGEPCSAGTVCATGLCNVETGVCVASCLGGTENGGGKCKCPANTVYDAPRCKLLDGFGDCTTGDDCHSGLCDVQTKKCTMTCQHATVDIGMGKCDCGPGTHRNPTSNDCAQDTGPCMLGTSCSSDSCNIVDDVGNGQCIAMCPGPAKTRDLLGKCVCAGPNEHPDPDHADACVCVANYENLGAGCKKKDDQMCSSNSECSHGICNETNACGPCGGDFMFNGTSCVAKSCTVNADCPVGGQCNENHLCGPCGSDFEVAGPDCLLKEGRTCSSGSQCSHGICNETGHCGTCGADLMASGGGCVAKICTLNSECVVGGQCNETSHCGPCGTNFQRSPSDGVCRLKGGQTCGSDDDCASGNCTGSNKCTAVM
jgi:hypothetical protein